MFGSILPVVGKGGARHKGGGDQYQYPYKWPLMSLKDPNKSFFFIEREGIEFIYCQYTPAVWGVISNTLPLWKKEWQYTASSWDELENTPPLGNLHPSALEITAGEVQE